MNKILREYQELAARAETQKKTLASFEKFMRLIGSKSDNHDINDVTEGLDPVNRLRGGELIAFQYSAKTAEELPYWDRYPLVIVTEIKKDGWVGINLHYLHPRHRARILYELHKRNKPIIGNELANLCTKRYLAKHVERKPRSFPPEYHDIAIMLPFDNFQKAAAATAWKETYRKRKK